MRNQPGVVAASPEVISQAGITAGQDYGEGVNLLGFDPDTGTKSVTSLPQSITKGDLSFRDHQAGGGRRRAPGIPAGFPALGVPGRHRHPGAGYPGQGQSCARGGGSAILEVRGHRFVRHRHVPVRQPIRGHVSGQGSAVHRPGRCRIRDCDPGRRPGASSRDWRGPGAPAGVSLPGSRLADPELQSVQRAPAGEARHGADYLFHHGRGRVQHRGDA